MLTDRHPIDYLYLSRRLLSDLVQHEQAAQSRWQFQPSFTLMGFSLGVGRRRADFDNLYDLAHRSQQLVSDNTGGLDQVGSHYVLATLKLRNGVFEPLMGWRGGRVACFQGEATADDGASVFVALFGSASNWRGFRADEETLSGFTPSDVMGLYGVLDAVREADDPEVGLEEKINELDLQRDHKLDEAVRFARLGVRSSDPQQLTFLARHLMSTENYQSDDGSYDRVLIAAPLWIATPMPTPSLRGIPTI
jgi:hypothetical protein